MPKRPSLSLIILLKELYPDIYHKLKQLKTERMRQYKHEYWIHKYKKKPVA